MFNVTSKATAFHRVDGWHVDYVIVEALALDASYLLNATKPARLPNARSYLFQEVEDWAKMPVEFHSFPTVDTLAEDATEADLRAIGGVQ